MNKILVAGVDKPPRQLEWSKCRESGSDKVLYRGGGGLVAGPTLPDPNPKQFVTLISPVQPLRSGSEYPICYP